MYIMLLLILHAIMMCYVAIKSILCYYYAAINFKSILCCYYVDIIRIAT